MHKFIHAADIHVDSPLIGLSQYEGAPVKALLGATRRALENMVDLAISEAVAFVIIAGDMFDGDAKDFNTALFFSGQMSRLQSAGIHVFVVTGNHDAASIIAGTGIRTIALATVITIMVKMRAIGGIGASSQPTLSSAA
jgi:exonuclease SbcD